MSNSICHPTLLRFLGSVVEETPSDVNFAFRADSKHNAVTLLTLISSSSISLAPSKYERPGVKCTFCPGQSPHASDLHFLGFQTKKFARPVHAPDVTLNFNFIPDTDLVQPPCVLPLFILQRSSPEFLFLAPCNSFHEQVLTIHDKTLQWGWSGDLKFLPRHFDTTLAAIIHTSPREALRLWCQLLRERFTFPPRTRYADVTMSRLSYWTDNGAAYWYRRESGLSLPQSIERTVNHIQKDLSLPIAAVEIDSWFYPHHITRDVQEVGYLHVVPPTGMHLWEPREDVLGPGGIAALHKRLGERPLILHCRHISSHSPYVNDTATGPWWVHGDGAHPRTAALWYRLMQQAVAWGAITFEQDWICDVWFGTQQLRETPGRVSQWQRDLNDAAEENGISLIWCMATPADMIHAALLNRVIAIRSCDDYRYADDPSTLWRWHLIVSTMIHSLGLYPYKDVFMSHHTESGAVDIDGDPNALLEACLATLSAGPVGIGDRLNRTDASVVSRCCRKDGLIIKPDIPLCALDRSFRDQKSLLWADTMCGEWRYVLVTRTGNKNTNDISMDAPLQETLELSASTFYAVYDWKSKEVFVTNRVTASLMLHEWELWVVCPILTFKDRSAKFALIGDTNAFATMGDRRIRMVTDVSDCERNCLNEDGVLFEVIGNPGEEVEISYWCEGVGLCKKVLEIPTKSWMGVVLGESLDSGAGFEVRIVN